MWIRLFFTLVLTRVLLGPSIYGFKHVSDKLNRNIAKLDKIVFGRS